MTTCLEKSSSFGLLCMAFVEVYEFLCTVCFFAFWFWGKDVEFDCINS